MCKSLSSCRFAAITSEGWVYRNEWQVVRTRGQRKAHTLARTRTRTRTHAHTERSHLSPHWRLSAHPCGLVALGPDSRADDRVPRSLLRIYVRLLDELRLFVHDTGDYLCVCTRLGVHARHPPRAFRKTGALSFLYASGALLTPSPGSRRRLRLQYLPSEQKCTNT